MRRLLPLLLLLAGLAAVPAARAQTVRWDPPGGTLPVGEVRDLRLVFEGCSPDGPPKFPKVDDLTLEYRGQATSMSLINGSFSSTVEMEVSVLLDQARPVDIPAFIVNTNKGAIHVPPVHFAPASATVGSSGVPLSDAATAQLTPGAGSVWAGEVFDLDYTIDVAASYSPNWGRGQMDWDPSPLIAEDWSLPAPYDDRASGRTGLKYHTRAVAASAGRLTLHPTNQLIALAVGVSGFGFFQQRQYQQFSVSDSLVTLDVRPLPPAPAAFQGAVGDFKISSKIVPVTVKVGEPVTWTVELSGTGNWPQLRGLPAREAPADFQVIQPKPKKTQPAGKLFDATLAEDVVLVPTKAGEYDLPPVDFVYFDPRRGTYQTISAPGAHVTAEAAAPAPAPGAVAPATGVPAITTDTGGAPPPEVKVPEAPTGGLGDPLAPAPAAPGLLGRREVALAVGAALALVLLLWAALATRRARATDPLRAQRAARRRLAATLERLRSAPGSERPALLLAWQRDSAVLWDIAHAAPPASRLPAADWAQLWTEADRSLYAAQTALPPDWGARAQAALTGKRLPALTPFSFLRPRNLLPLLVLALAARSGAAAPDPLAAYRSGDFAAAERAWADAVAVRPLDWSARHNLSLALGQQDRWGEAAAQAAAAFLQHPHSPATRRQVALAAEKAGFMPEPVDGLVQPGPVAALATLLSPGAWERTGVAAGWTVAAALALTLLAAYGTLRRRPALAAAAALALVGILAGLAALLSLHAYGIGADPRAVIVWRAGILRSIPSEADLKQKTTSVAAGATAVVDRTFLRWQHLAFANGQTGWVPESESIFLWQAPPK